MSIRIDTLKRADELARAGNHELARQLRERIATHDACGFGVLLDAPSKGAVRTDAAEICGCSPVTHECSCEPWRPRYLDASAPSVRRGIQEDSVTREQSEMAGRDAVMREARRLGLGDAPADARAEMIEQRRRMCVDSNALPAAAPERADSSDDPVQARAAMIAARRRMCTDSSSQPAPQRTDNTDDGLDERQRMIARRRAMAHGGSHE